MSTALSPGTLVRMAGTVSVFVKDGKLFVGYLMIGDYVVVLDGGKVVGPPSAWSGRIYGVLTRLGSCQVSGPLLDVGIIDP